jgi:hypothetical protein
MTRRLLIITVAEHVMKDRQDTAPQTWRWRPSGITTMIRDMTGTSRSTGGVLKKSPSSLRLHKTRSQRDLATRTAQRTREALLKSSVEYAPSTRKIHGMRPVLENIDEGQSSPVTTNSPKRQSAQSPDDILLSASEKDLMRRPQADLARAILTLRKENEELRRVKVPTRSSSQRKNNFNDLPITREQWKQQQERLTAANEELSRIKTDLEQEKIKCADAERNRRRISKKLALATRTEGNMYDDNHFKEEMETLRYKVYNWSRNQSWKVVNLDGNVSRSKLISLSHDYHFMRPTCPRYQEYVTSKQGIDLLVEAHIWQCLAGKVFRQNLWSICGIGESKGPSRRSRNIFSEWEAHIGTYSHQTFQKHTNKGQRNPFLKTNMLSSVKNGGLQRLAS